MTKQILLLGDSHSDIFLKKKNIKRFEMSQCKSNVFTTHRFADQSELDLWSKLDPWLQHNSNNSPLIITGGEIDIRAHFWRHIPRIYNEPNDITTYISDKALKFYKMLCLTYEKYRLEKIVIWGAPVAGERATYSYQVPFVGSSQTRNMIIHLWNKSILECIENDPRISFTTAYYNFINPIDYNSTPNPSPDGVHWDYENGEFSFRCYNELVLPALSYGSLLGDNFSIMKNDQFEITESASTGIQQYDTWARTDQLLENTNERTVSINNISYSWVRSNQRSLLPNEYKELSMNKRTNYE
jgi:hypothetical protein